MSKKDWQNKLAISKKFVFLLVTVFVLLALGHTAFALEVTYPVIPGFPDINTNPDMPKYIDYFFGFAIVTAGIIAVISIAISGFKILLSAGNPTAIGEAKERLFGSILGIVLLLVSFILLRTINPALINPRNVTLTTTPTPGVYAWRYVAPTTYTPFNNPFALSIAKADYSDPLDGIEFVPLPEADPDLQDLKSQGFNNVICFTSDLSPEIFVEKYAELNFEINDPDLQTDATDEENLQCYKYEDIDSVAELIQKSLPINNVESLTWQEKAPGVYLYPEPNCDGPSSGHITASGSIADDYQNKVRSVRIINGKGPNEPFYGFVLNKAPNLKGECSLPVVNLTEADINNPNNDGLCVPVSADDSCNVIQNTHTVCDFDAQKCEPASGQGDNQCTTNSECIPHNECSNQQCVPLEWPGTYTSTCSTDSDCTGGDFSHTICDYSQQQPQCISVNGVGDNQCSTGTVNTDCPPQTSNTTITVIKTVINTGGGTKTVADFPLYINPMPVVAGQEVVVGSTAQTPFAPGNYVASEISNPNYDVSYSGDCDSTGHITLTTGQNPICTITNTKNATPSTALLKLNTTVSGGTALASSWTLTAQGTGGFSDTGDSNIFHSINVGTSYSLLASSSNAGYTASAWTCDGGTLTGNSITLTSTSQTVTCTVTQTYGEITGQQGTLKIVKNVVINPLGVIGIAYGNGLFVATLSDGHVVTSNNGITWNLRTAPLGSWFSITYGNGLFVVVGPNASQPNQFVMTSPNGIDWTLQTTPSGVWNSVTYGTPNGNGLFVAVSGTGSIMTSSDGINWTLRKPPAGETWADITYGALNGNGLFMTVGLNITSTSPDGITWTPKTVPGRWNGIAYGTPNGNGLFVMVSGDGPIQTSPNGITWTPRTAATNSWGGIAYGIPNGSPLFVATGIGTNNPIIVTSPNGITWTPQTVPGYTHWDIVYSGNMNGLFVATAGGNNPTITSSNGTTWNLGTVSIPTTSFSFAGNFGPIPSITTNSTGEQNIQLNPSSSSNTYTISENPQNEWSQQSATCTSGLPSNINIVATQTTTCTFTNIYTGSSGGSSNPPPPPPTSPTTITVIKTVVNTDGGIKTSADFAPFFVNAMPVTSGVPQAFAPGDYVVSEDTLDPNYDVSFSGDCDATGNIGLAEGEEKICTITNTYNVSNTATVSGKVFVDANQDGVPNIESGDTGMGGVTVTLQNYSTDTIQTTVTSTSDSIYIKGNYTFSVPPQATYEISINVPPGYTLTTQNNPISRTLDSNGSGGDNVNFGISNTSSTASSIQGTVFVDLDGNGQKNGNEAGYSQGPLLIKAWSSGNSVLVQSTNTNPVDGSYVLTGLPSGTYFIELVMPSGYVSLGYAGAIMKMIEASPTTTNAIVDFPIQTTSLIPRCDTTMNACSFSSSATGALCSSQGAACNTTTATTHSISGTVFIDTNANGVLDTGAGEQAFIAGAVQLTLSGAIYDGTITQNGTYTFAGVPDGDYDVSITPADPGLAGYIITGPTTVPVTLSGGNAIVNFGIKPKLISGKVFVDANGNGFWDENELGYAGSTDENGEIIGATITLKDSVGNYIDEITTDSDGNYVFSESFDQTTSYLVELTLPDEYIKTTAIVVQITAQNVDSANFGIQNTLTSGMGKLNIVKTIEGVVTTPPSGWYGIAYGNGVFVAVGFGPNQVMTSVDNGANWKTQTVPANNWLSVAFGNGKFVAVGYGTNKIMTSTDNGVTWIPQTTSPAVDLNGVAFGNGKFVAVGTHYATTSTDGITWTTPTFQFGNWSSVAYGNGKFAAVTFGGNQAMALADGSTAWSLGTTPTGNWSNMAFGNGTFVAVNAGVPQTITSTSGTTWSNPITTPVSSLGGVTFGNNVFIATSYGGDQIARSTNNGASWTAYTYSGNWGRVAYGGNGIFVILGYDGKSMTSIDSGATFSSLARGTFNFADNIALDSITIDAGATSGYWSAALPAGTGIYHIEEAPSPGWDLTGAVCINANTGAFYPIGAITIDADGVTTCQFINKYKGSISYLPSHYLADIIPTNTTTAKPKYLASLFNSTVYGNILAQATTPPPSGSSCPAFEAQSIYIIKIAKDVKGAGTGISIYEDGGGNPDNITGPKFFNISPEVMGKEFALDGTNPDFPYTNPDDLLINKGLVDSTAIGEDTCAQKDPETGEPTYDYPCTKSIVLRGNYLNIIYKQNENTQNKTCEFYLDNINNLSQNNANNVSQESIIDNNNKIKGEYFFPIFSP